MATNFPTSLDSFNNPTSANSLSDIPVLHSAQHANANDAIEALEAKVGVSFSSVTTSLDFITQVLLLTSVQHPTGGYREITGGVFPSKVIWYTDSGKTIKLIEKTYTYGSSIPVLPTVISLQLYDGTVSNTLKRTITDNITYNKVFETSRSRTIT